MTIQDGEPALSRYHLKSLVRLRFGHSCRKARVTWYPAIRSGQLADCESIRVILYVPISSSIPSARAAIPKCRPICRAIIAVVSLTAYTAGISQLLPAVIGAEATVAESGCPTVMSCAVTAAYGPCCCLTSTEPSPSGTAGLMAVGCALPDDYGIGTLSLPSHTVFTTAPLLRNEGPSLLEWPLPSHGPLHSSVS